MINSGLPVLELPKSVAVNSLARQRAPQAGAAGQPGSPSDSRSSTPRSHGHALRSSEDCNRQQALIRQLQGEQCCVPQYAAVQSSSCAWWHAHGFEPSSRHSSLLIEHLMLR
jgi:hypothetical protein